LSAYDIASKLDIPKRAIYQLRNKNAIRWIRNTTKFNLDDVREYVKNKGYEHLIEEINER